MIAFFRWLFGRKAPAVESLIYEFRDRVVEVRRTGVDGGHKFDVVVLSGPPWSEAEALRLLAFFQAELARQERGES